MKRKIQYLDSMEVEEISDLTETLVKVNRSAAVVMLRVTLSREQQCVSTTIWSPECTRATAGYFGS